MLAATLRRIARDLIPDLEPVGSTALEAALEASCT
jgi:hypothetical protein